MQWRKILKTISNVVFTVVIGFLILAALLLMISNFGGNGQAMIGNFGTARVATGSMEPELPTGCFILIERVDPATLQIGDTITFWSEDPNVPSGYPVSHRIERIETSLGEPRYFTKGIANSMEDPYPVRSESILGKVIWHSVVLGNIVGFVQSPYGFPILIGILAVTLVFNIFMVAKEAKKVSDASNEAAVAAAREEVLRELRDAEQASEQQQSDQ